MRAYDNKSGTICLDVEHQKFKENKIPMTRPFIMVVLNMLGLI
jgi:hypothetical protein